MPTAILISDLHLTANERDNYRWGLFGWLATKSKGIDSLYILGDLTDSKDFHSAVLVNRVIQALKVVLETSTIKHIVILRGNHDGIDPDWPYFRFLNEIPQIKFINTPISIPTKQKKVIWFLPHSRNPEKEWKDIDLKSASVIFTHITLSGTIAENGVELPGVSKDVFQKTKAKIFSGDVHVPQQKANITYVGAPYPIKFGDTFKPTVLVIDAETGEVARMLSYPSIKRLVLTVRNSDFIMSQKTFNAGDQVKVKIELTKSEYVDWRKTQKRAEEWVKEKGLELCGVQLVSTKEDVVKKSDTASPIPKQSPLSLFTKFCKDRNIDPDLKEVGKRIVQSLHRGA